MRSDPHATSGQGPGISPLGALAFAARVLEASVVVFTRTRFGERYLGVQALAVLPAVVLFASSQEGFSPDGLFSFLGAWLVAFVIARLGVLDRIRRDDTEHSYYNGFPILMRLPLIRGISERSAKVALEPVVIFVVGAVLKEESDPALGNYLMWAAVGTLVSAAITQAQERQRLVDLRDAQLEQRYLAKRFRENRWN